MIQFEDLDLIAVIKGKQYRIVFDKDLYAYKYCSLCALKAKLECGLYACYTDKLDKHFHYEEIPI